ncbi:MAG: histidine phosphatase family protein [Patescibacteria group bacterium]|nr:histidine phosphatase family protein [Patescibacteria group bacterium]
MGDLKVFVFRHGDTEYRQGDNLHSVATANDLTPVGVRTTQVSAMKLLPLLDRGKGVQIHSAPSGRTLHTAKIISDTLRDDGFFVSPISPEYSLREVEGFSWRLFIPLVHGGEVQYAGHVFSVNKQETNPNGLDHIMYFMEDKAREIPDYVKKKWPPVYVQFLDKLETYRHANKRMIVFLRSLFEHQQGRQIIVVTHGALANSMCSMFTTWNKCELERSEFLHLQSEGDGLFVKRVVDITEGERVNVLKLAT